MNEEEESVASSDGEGNKNDKKDLKPLTANLDFVQLSRGLNKRMVFGNDVPLSKIGNYSCPVCRLFFKDSSVYLKHLTSPEHNAKLGMSMQVPAATDEQVIQRVQQWEDFYMKGIDVQPLFQQEGK